MKTSDPGKPSPPHVMWMIWGDWRLEDDDIGTRHEVSVFYNEADAIEAAKMNVGGESVDEAGGRCRVYRLTLECVGEAYIDGPKYRKGEA
jgi:hypothetical protein